MTPPILYYDLISPPSRTVLLTAKAIGIELELREVQLLRKMEHLSPDFKKMNPQHTVPVLDDNGTIIVDSHVIAGYLCDKYGKNDQLYPRDMLQRALVDTRMHFDTGCLFARARFIYEPVLAFGQTEEHQRKIEYLQLLWPIMEAFLENSDYICGNSMTIADLCCATSVTSVDKVAPIDPVKYPKFTAWLTRMEQFPDYENLNIKGAHLLQETYKHIMQESKIKVENAYII